MHPFAKFFITKLKNTGHLWKTARHRHLKPTTPNSLLTNAFLIISVINVSYCAIRLISHMQSSDHLERGEKKGWGEKRGKIKKKKRG